MTVDDYKQQITLRIKDEINRWIDELKEKDKELLLTKQWSVLFPKGFKSGFNALPVVTHSKQGKHLVAEVEFVLPESLELDMESIELSLKNEPYQEDQKRVPRHTSLNDPLDILNGIIININSFLQGLSPTSRTPLKSLHMQSPGINPLNISREAVSSQGIRINHNDTSDIDSIRKTLLQSSYLPDWFKTIDSMEIREQLLSKIAESLAHYQRQVGHAVDLNEFFEKYTEMLLKQDKLYHYCKYKSKPVELDSDQHCTENYCSKKPYHDECPNATLRFGIKPTNP